MIAFCFNIRSFVISAKILGDTSHFKHLCQSEVVVIKNFKALNSYFCQSKPGIDHIYGICYILVKLFIQSSDIFL